MQKLGLLDSALPPDDDGQTVIINLQPVEHSGHSRMLQLHYTPRFIHFAYIIQWADTCRVAHYNEVFKGRPDSTMTC